MHSYPSKTLPEFVMNFQFNFYLCNEMKVLACFLSVYMVLLALTPCGDKEEHRPALSNYATYGEMVYESDNAHGIESCSPFCSCACCSISLIRTWPLPSTQVKRQSLKMESVYNPILIFGTSSSIWEPPQFS